MASTDMPFGPAVDPDQALEALEAVVQSADADGFDAFLTGRVGQYTRFADDRIHQPQDITEVQVMVRAVVGGHAARAAVSSLAEASAAARQAAAMARSIAAVVPGGGPTRIATPEDAVERSPASSSLVYDSTVELDAPTRVAWVRTAQQEATGHGGWIAGMIGRAWTQLVVASSNGVRRSTSATEASYGFTAGVGDGTAHIVDLARSASRLGLPTAIPYVVGQAAASVGRTELAPGRYTVVLGPEATAELLEFLPAFGFAGELAAAGVGVCARAGGRPVASDLVTVADNAHADVGLPIGFDIEGVSKQQVVLLKRGIVGGPITDLATAAALGGRSTGHAHIAREEAPATKAANLVMTPGEQSEAELVAGVDHGVYIQRFWYSRVVDPAASTITGVTRDACFEIVDGQLARPLAGMRFTESVLGLLATVDGVGSQLRSAPIMNVWNGSTTAPAIRAHGMRLGAAPQETGGAR